MGNCCQRRADNDEYDNDVDEDDGIAIQWWSQVTRRFRRLAFKRRQWAYLGHLLRLIKQAGASRPVGTDPCETVTACTS